MKHFGLSEAGVRRRSAAPTPSSRSRRCRASTRCGGGSRRPRCCRRSRSWGSASSRSARWAGLPDRQDRRRRRPSTAADFRNTVPRFTPENRAANQALVDLVKQDRRPPEGRRRRRSRSPGCSRSKPWIVPIPGTTKLHRLEENLGAPSVDAHRRRSARSSTRLARTITVQGERYSGERAADASTADLQRRPSCRASAAALLRRRLDRLLRLPRAARAPR